MSKYLVNACANVQLMGFSIEQYSNGQGQWFVTLIPKTKLLDEAGAEIRVRDSTQSPIKEVGPLAGPLTFAEMYNYRDQIFKRIAKFLINSKIDNAAVDEADLRAEFGNTLVDEVLAGRVS